MESLVPTVLIFGTLLLVWVLQATLRNTLAVTLHILADVAKSPDILGYGDTMHLLWALGVTDKNALQASRQDIEEFARLIRNLAALKDEAERERRDVGEVGAHARSVIADCRRDIAVVRHRIAATCLGPRTTEVWSSALIEEDQGIPYLPGSDEEERSGGCRSQR